MILYHGSFLKIAKPDLAHSRPNVDFGRGFYVTPLYEQAAKLVWQVQTPWERRHYFAL